MLQERIPLKEYATIANDFNPTEYNPETWVKMAKYAGMKYLVITSKHHDGFAMYNSPSSDYNIVTRTPYGKDPMKRLVEACRKEGLGFGFYYSLGRDWQDPDVPTNWPTKGGRSNTWDYPDEDAKILSAYIERKVKPQLRELLTQYGKIDFIWFDTPELVTPEQSRELRELIHSLQPDCLINERIGNGYGDFTIAEQVLADSINPHPWEACITMGRNWEYNRYDTIYKKPEVIIRHFTDIVSKGGNLLLNVTPDGKGRIPTLSRPIVEGLHQWLQRNGEAIYNTKPWKTFGENLYKNKTYAKENIMAFNDAEYDGTPKNIIPDFRYTCRGNDVYVIARHVQKASFTLEAFAGEAVQDISCLGENISLDWTIDTNGLHINLRQSPSHPIYVLKVSIDKMAWWREARFGMFIHWGPYAVLGGDFHGYLTRVGGPAWIMNRCKIPVKEYQEMTRTFNPTQYNPEEWVLTAKNAGMKYIVITAKHHDGFAMFKSKASSYNIVDFTLYGKDVLDGLAKACRKHGMKLGFYYSQAQDWNNPGGATHRRPMRQGWPNPDSARIDAYTLQHEGSWDAIQQTRTFAEYTDSIAVPQIKELLSNYGDVAIIWWDTPSGAEEQAQKLHKVLEEYPQVITNDRLYRGSRTITGDYKTPEQTIPDVRQLDGTDWETCMTLNNSWGYQCRGVVWKSPRTLITSLIDIASKGGNLLLNVGPDPNGTLPQENMKRLATIGTWMKKYGNSIYGTERCVVRKPDFGYCTQKIVGNKTFVYLHVIDWPTNGELLFRLYEKASQARLLPNGENIPLRNTQDGIYLQVPKNAPDSIASVIELQFDYQLPRYPFKPMNDKYFDIIDANKQ